MEKPQRERIESDIEVKFHYLSNLKLKGDHKVEIMTLIKLVKEAINLIRTEIVDVEDASENKSHSSVEYQQTMLSMLRNYVFQFYGKVLKKQLFDHDLENSIIEILSTSNFERREDVVAIYKNYCEINKPIEFYQLTHIIHLPLSPLAILNLLRVCLENKDHAKMNEIINLINKKGVVKNEALNSNIEAIYCQEIINFSKELKAYYEGLKGFTKYGFKTPCISDCFNSLYVNEIPVILMVTLEAAGFLAAPDRLPSDINRMFPFLLSELKLLKRNEISPYTEITRYLANTKNVSYKTRVLLRWLHSMQKNKDSNQYETQQTMAFMDISNKALNYVPYQSDNIFYRLTKTNLTEYLLVAAFLENRRQQPNYQTISIYLLAIIDYTNDFMANVGGFLSDKPYNYEKCYKQYLIDLKNFASELLFEILTTHIINNYTDLTQKQKDIKFYVEFFHHRKELDYSEKMLSFLQNLTREDNEFSLEYIHKILASKKESLEKFLVIHNGLTYSFLGEQYFSSADYKSSVAYFCKAITAEYLPQKTQKELEGILNCLASLANIPEGGLVKNETSNNFDKIKNIYYQALSLVNIYAKPAVDILLPKKDNLDLLNSIDLLLKWINGQPKNERNSNFKVYKKLLETLANNYNYWPARHTLARLNNQYYRDFYKNYAAEEYPPFLEDYIRKTNVTLYLASDMDTIIFDKLLLCFKTYAKKSNYNQEIQLSFDEDVQCAVVKLQNRVISVLNVLATKLEGQSLNLYIRLLLIMTVSEINPKPQEQLKSNIYFKAAYQTSPELLKKYIDDLRTKGFKGIANKFDSLYQFYANPRANDLVEGNLYPPLKSENSQSGLDSSKLLTQLNHSDNQINSATLQSIESTVDDKIENSGNQQTMQYTIAQKNTDFFEYKQIKGKTTTTYEQATLQLN